jgi:hypothetical protein
MNTAHRFAVGQRVYVKPSLTNTATGSYKVLRHMPAEGEENIYRVKNDTEPYERVVRESQLTPAS